MLDVLFVCWPFFLVAPFLPETDLLCAGCAVLLAILAIYAGCAGYDGHLLCASYAGHIYAVCCMK